RGLDSGGEASRGQGRSYCLPEPTEAVKDNGNGTQDERYSQPAVHRQAVQRVRECFRGIFDRDGHNVPTASKTGSRAACAVHPCPWFPRPPAPATRMRNSLRRRRSLRVEQGRSDSNAQPPVLETGALPIELHPSEQWSVASGQ